MGTAKHPRRSPLDAKKCGSAASAPQHVTTAGSLPQKQYEKQPQIDTFNRELLLKLNQLPGVQSVGLTSMLPSQGVNNNQTFFRRRIHSATQCGHELGKRYAVMGNFFPAMGIHLLRGRFFTHAHHAGTQPVLIVNHKLAQHYWPNQNPIGKRIHIGTPKDADSLAHRSR